MKQLIEEYGTTLLYVITGLLCIGLFSAAFFGDNSSVSKVVNSATDTAASQDMSIAYTITYEGMEDATFGNQYVPSSFTREDGNIVLPKPSKSGWLFAGWVGTRVSDPTMEVVIPHGSTGNRKYTATWTKGYFRLIFNNNLAYYWNEEGTSGLYKSNSLPNLSKNLIYSWMSGYTDSELVEYEKSTTIRDSNFVFKGHRFAGWNTKPDGTGAKYIAGTSQLASNISTKTSVDWSIENITLYAQWELVYYDINYIRSYALVKDSTATAYFDPETNPSKYRIIDTIAPTGGKLLGYTEDAWYTRDPYATYGYTETYNGIPMTITKETYRLGASVNPDTPAYYRDKGLSNIDKIMPGNTGTLTLYAHWKADEYEVIFDMNLPKFGKASEVMNYVESKKVNYDEPYGDMNDLWMSVRETEDEPTVTYKYIFMGWYLEPECINKVTSESIVKTIGNHKLYAYWKPVDYIIRLRSNY